MGRRGAWQLTAAALLLLSHGGAGDNVAQQELAASCPSVTRTTWAGTSEYECGGALGACNTKTGECTCLPGRFWATWQVNAGNIEPPRGSSCGGGVRAKATDMDLHTHKLAFASAYSFEFFGLWWLFGPTLPGVALPPPRIAVLAERPWLLPKLAMLAGCFTLLASEMSQLLAGPECNCYWLAVRSPGQSNTQAP